MDTTLVATVPYCVFDDGLISGEEAAIYPMQGALTFQNGEGRYNGECYGLDRDSLWHDLVLRVPKA